MGEDMDPYFALFNSHKNDAASKATEDFKQEFGEGAYDDLHSSWENPPSGNGGIMALVTELEPTQHIVWFLLRVQMYVNDSGKRTFDKALDFAHEQLGF